MSVDTPGRGRQGRAQPGVSDSNISPVAKPEATEVTPNRGTLSVTDNIAQEVPQTDLDYGVLGEGRAGGPEPRM